MEMYENQRPFSLEDLVTVSSFLNNFVFKILWNNLIGNLTAYQILPILTKMYPLMFLDIKTISNSSLLNSTHSLLMLLYKRDSRRHFTPPDHWLIK